MTPVTNYVLLYSTLLCKNIARAPGGHKICIPTKLGGGGQNRFIRWKADFQIKVKRNHLGKLFDFSFCQKWKKRCLDKVKTFSYVNWSFVCDNLKYGCVIVATKYLPRNLLKTNLEQKLRTCLTNTCCNIMHFLASNTNVWTIIATHRSTCAVSFEIWIFAITYWKRWLYKICLHLGNNFCTTNKFLFNGTFNFATIQFRNNSISQQFNFATIQFRNNCFYGMWHCIKI